ncbi:hypothetical protein D3C72_2027360 [compost metagenome]
MDVERGGVGNARHREVAKVALLDDTVLQCDGRACQAHRQTHDCRALHLCFHGAGIHYQVAMHAGADTMQSRAAFLHRGLHDIGHHGIERLMHRDTPGVAGGQLLPAVPALVHRQLQRSAMARMLVAEQAHAVSHRILFGGARNLV